MELRGLGTILLSISIPMMALSILIFYNLQLFYVSLGVFVVGLAAFSVSERPIFPYVIREMIESSALNVEAIIEEFDARGKGIYLNKGGRSVAFIPFTELVEVDKETLEEIISLPLRVLNKGGVFVFIPMPLVEVEGEVSDESFLRQVLVEYLDFADDVKLVKSVADKGIKLRVSIENPKGKYLNIPRYEKTLGHLEGSIALSALSKYYGKPVRFIGEAKATKSLIIEGEIING